MKRIVACITATSLAACATIDGTYVPVIDWQGVDNAKFEADLRECRALAKQRLDAQAGAVAGAIAGAVLTVAIGAVLGLDGRDLARAAGVGAVGGGVGGAANADNDQRQIIANCLSGRGYKVVGL